MTLKLRLIVLAVAVVATSACLAMDAPGDCNVEFAVTKKFEYEVHLEGPLSPEELERRHAVVTEENQPPVPFGFLNENWQEMMGMYQASDCIYEFKSVGGWKAPSGGVRGVILIRSGEIIAGFRTAIT